MSAHLALRAVLAVALAGVAFSGLLAYRELFTAEAACAPVTPPGTLFGYPPCLYGLGMYVSLAVIAAWGLRAGQRGHTRLRDLPLFPD